MQIKKKKHKISLGIQMNKFFFFLLLNNKLFDFFIFFRIMQHGAFAFLKKTFTVEKKCSQLDFIFKFAIKFLNDYRFLI
jgi:hypothetical protein